MTASTGSGSPAPLVVVTVGSDHHQFDRLVSWVDRWLAAGAADRVDCVIQYGTSTPPRHGRAVAYLDHAELQDLLASASVVITQGGPMSIVESRRHGRRPIVLPRTPHLGEVVDDHQHSFCVRMAAEGLIHLVDGPESLERAVEDVLADPLAGSVQADPDHDRRVGEAVDRFAGVVDGVLARRPGAGPSVVMLGGFGRSGSTLLERSLAEAPGVVGVGEVLHLWERSLRDDDRCGCGEPFSECDVWQGVGKAAFGGWEQVDVDEAIADRRDVVGNRHLLALITGLMPPARRLRTDRLLRRIDALYRGVASETGARVIVDSSKHPAYAFLVRRASVRLRCVLVVRDPRGVAYSWSKRVDRPEVTGGHAQMPMYSPATAAVRWSLYSVLFHALSALRVPVMTVRYEDMVSDLSGTLSRILRFVGEDPKPQDLAHVSEGAVTLSAHHTVAGNPMRFLTGTLGLRADTEWRKHMDPLARRLVSLLTAPLRLGYRYR